MIPQRQAAQFDLPSGTMLGKYEILRKLAMGGMAEIYLSRVRGTAGFEKLVVLKRILPTVANDPSFVRMFLDEARLAATLRHPNIADVYEVGEHEGSPFFAMEFVHGQDVRSIRIAARERKDGVPLAIALAIIHGTASALDYAHDRNGPDGANLGLVHRDVSPSNILVSYEGAIKLIDFGIARAASKTQHTQTGTLKGKIPYMSPEQCRGLPLDRRSDLFSLGVVMYELTASRRPFRGENDFAIMDQIVHHGAQPPSTVMRGYPAELEAIVMRLLAPKAEARYQTAEEMLHDLDPFLAQHRLWVPPKPLSKYMRMIFADAVTAWDQALDEGVSLSAHVAATVTSQSASSQLVTPPSAFPGLVPLSQEIPAVRPTTDQPAVGPTSAMQPAASVSEIVDMPSRPTEYPKLKRSGGGLVFALVAVLALGVGGFVAFTVVKHDTRPAKSDEPTTPVAVEPPPHAAATVPRVEPPLDATPVETKPVVTAPRQQAEQPDSTDPKPKPVVETKPPPRRPPPRRSPPRLEPTVKPVKEVTPPKDVTPPKEPTPKDPGWNQDSPFLPPHK